MASVPWALCVKVWRGKMILWQNLQQALDTVVSVLGWHSLSAVSGTIVLTTSISLYEAVCCLFFLAVHRSVSLHGPWSRCSLPICKDWVVYKRKKRVTLRVLIDCHVVQELSSRAALPLSFHPIINITCMVTSLFSFKFHDEEKLLIFFWVTHSSEVLSLPCLEVVGGGKPLDKQQEGISFQFHLNMFCTSSVPLALVQRKSLETFTICHRGLHSLKHNNTNSVNSKQNYFLPTDLSIIICLGSCQSVCCNTLEISNLFWIGVLVRLGTYSSLLILPQILLHKGMSACRSQAFVDTCFGVVHLILLFCVSWCIALPSSWFNDSWELGLSSVGMNLSDMVWRFAVLRSTSLRESLGVQMVN